MSIEDKIKKNVPLAPLTTFKIGGAAKFFLETTALDDLLAALAWAEDHEEKVFIFGGGSNLLVNDAGVSGLVIKMANNSIQARSSRLECGAGAGLGRAARLAASRGLTGLEWSVGIPQATIGGAIRGNAEAFGTGMENLTETVVAVNLGARTSQVLSNHDCRFAYRTSIFKENKQLLVWSATLKLKPAAAADIEALIERSVKFRTDNYPRLPSAGSIFKSVPVKYIEERHPGLIKRIPGPWTERLGNVGAGLVIDRLLDLKGKTIGGAKISLEHANHIVNTGKATAEDVIMLINYIKEKARHRLNLELQEEIEYFGF